MILRPFIFLLTILTIAPEAWGQNEIKVVPINRSFAYSDLMGNVGVYTDPSQKLSAQQVLGKNFVRPSSGTPNFGIDGLIHWIQFQCQNTSDTAIDIVTEVDIVYADQVDFYVFDQKGKLIRKIENQSWKTPLNEREIESRYFAFNVPLEANADVQVLIRIQANAGILSCPVSLWSQRHYNRYYLGYTLQTVVAVCILFFIFSLSLIVGIWLRLALSMYYGLYLLGTCGYILYLEGLMAHSLPIPFSDIKFYSVAASLSRIGSILFVFHFIFSDKTTRIRTISALRMLAWFVVALHLVWISFCLVTPFSRYSALVSNALNITYILTLLCFLTLGIYHKKVEAKWYLVAMLPVCLSSVLNMSAVLGLLPSGDFTYLFNYYTPIWDFTVLGIGIVYRILKERDTANVHVRRLQAELIATQNTERERIAQDLHDDLGGTIATVNTRLSALLKGESLHPFQSEIKLLSEIVGKAGDQIRQISHNLMPPEFRKSGLVESVKERVVSIVSPRYTVSVFGNEQGMLPERELNIYRILMEIFNNIQKHAAATAVSVQFLFHPDILTIVIEDNGKNGLLKNNTVNHSGIGLKNINSRLLYLNGRMQSDENPSGTTLIVDIPYDRIPSPA